MSDFAFETFYRSTRDDCFRALIVAIGDVHEADELLAEAYTRALERWHTLESHPSTSAWILTVAMNLHRDRWRRAQRAIRRLAVSAPEDLPTPIDPRLISALTSLSDQQRLAVAYRIILDLDTAETARAMGVSAGTVTAHLHRGLTALRTRLRDYEVT